MADTAIGGLGGEAEFNATIARLRDEERQKTIRLKQLQIQQLDNKLNNLQSSLVPSGGIAASGMLGVLPQPSTVGQFAVSNVPSTFGISISPDQQTLAAGLAKANAKAEADRAARQAEYDQMAAAGFGSGQLSPDALAALGSRAVGGGLTRAERIAMAKRGAAGDAALRDALADINDPLEASRRRLAGDPSEISQFDIDRSMPRAGGESKSAFDQSIDNLRRFGDSVAGAQNQITAMAFAVTAVSRVFDKLRENQESAMMTTGETRQSLAESGQAIGLDKATVSGLITKSETPGGLGAAMTPQKLNAIMRAAATQARSGAPIDKAGLMRLVDGVATGRLSMDDALNDIAMSPSAMDAGSTVRGVNRASGQAGQGLAFNLEESERANRVYTGNAAAYEKGRSAANVTADIQASRSKDALGAFGAYADNSFSRALFSEISFYREMFNGARDGLMSATKPVPAVNAGQGVGK